VHPTSGTLRVFRHFSWLEVGSVKIAFSQPAHQRVTRAVETVEKVSFQKMIFEKWERNAEKRLVLDVPHNISAIIWQF
jgi:peptidyl-tRNA hydrolase